MKTVFTTGEAAEICKVSQQTIIRCFDSGRLKGFRVPGSRFRRIPRDALMLFMKENGIPPAREWRRGRHHYGVVFGKWVCLTTSSRCPPTYQNRRRDRRTRWRWIRG